LGVGAPESCAYHATGANAHATKHAHARTHGDATAIMTCRFIGAAEGCAYHGAAANAHATKHAHARMKMERQFRSAGLFRILIVVPYRAVDLNEVEWMTNCLCDVSLCAVRGTRTRTRGIRVVCCNWLSRRAHLVGRGVARGQGGC
jgi:hypothetical protein